MAAKLGNVIYWTCCGVAALWLVAVAYFEMFDRTSPLMARKWELTSPANVTYTVRAPADLTREQALRAVNFAASMNGLRDATSAELEKWFEHDPSLVQGIRTLLNVVLLFGFVPALVVWLFGRACRYVLAGT